MDISDDGDSDEEEEEGEAGAEAATSASKSQVGSVGKWSAKCDEIVAGAEGGKVLNEFLARRHCLTKVMAGTSLQAGGEKLLVNPLVFICPFKFRDANQEVECTAMRHSLGAMNALKKVCNVKQGHLMRAHKVCP